MSHQLLREQHINSIIDSDLHLIICKIFDSEELFRQLKRYMQLMRNKIFNRQITLVNLN